MTSPRIFRCRAILIAALVMFLALQASAQNRAPVVGNVTVAADTLAHIVTIRYDVSDAESDALRVTVGISQDSGRTFLVPVDSLQGDAGYPVSSGLQKEIRWYYVPGTIGAAPAASWMARVSADDGQPADIGALVAQVDSNRLKRDLAFIEGIRHRSAGPAHLEAVKDSIDARFRESGLHRARHAFTYLGYGAANITGRKPGVTDERTTYIVGGHFDTVTGSPGADDNGSGVAGLLEAMRVLSAGEYRNTVKFIGFDLEEDGLVGSGRYVSAGVPVYENIAGAIVYEMIGYASNDSGSQMVPPGLCTMLPALCDSLAADKYRGNFLLNVANTASHAFRVALDSCARRYVPALRVLSLEVPGNGQIAPDFRRSDHARFWDANRQALMLTDAANYRNLNYHTAGDTIGTLDFRFMSNIVKATVATVATLAGIRHSGSGFSPLFTLPVTAAERSDAAADGFALLPNYPNPFGPASTSGSSVTNIGFTLPRESFVSLSVHDVLGRRVAVAAQGRYGPGQHRVVLNSGDLPGGVYLCRLVASPRSDAHRTSTTITGTLTLLR
ncbi:MAG: M28 family peptidase [Ignavibacteria bacterium]|nr:M28 family peptidase [Ignavibacteria bacterium]